jgi:cell division protein ZapE
MRERKGAVSFAAGDTLEQRYERSRSERGYLPDGAQLAALERLEALRTRLLTKPQPRPHARRARGAAQERAAQGLYLYGGVGRGKTWLMDLFYDSVPGLALRRHFHHFMRDVHAQLRQLRSRREPLDAVAKALSSTHRVLCLDELYVSDIADAMILGTLFEALLRHGLMLVITSNFAPRELYRGGLQRDRFVPAIELLERELEVCSLEGAVDYRLRQMRRAPTYLDSGASDSAAGLQRLYAQLTGEAAPSATQLSILGHRLTALARHGDVVWFSFGTLCEGPRSQNDYAEIAQEFRTVLLSDVPVFRGPEQDNAARRFIALIDEFYDQGTKLVLSAAAPPAQLYCAERLRLEFRRTASRLIEMQTESYLARPRRR